MVSNRADESNEINLKGLENLQACHHHLMLDHHVRWCGSSNLQTPQG